jgi:hypothetical protein
MPAPGSYSYAVDTLVAAHTAVLGEIDGGVGAGKIRCYSEADVLLADIILTDPAGTVNGTTGQLTLTEATAGTGLADATCTYATITDSANVVIATMPASQGTSAVSGQIVLNSTAIVTGASVSLTSATIG